VERRVGDFSITRTLIVVDGEEGGEEVNIRFSGELRSKLVFDSPKSLHTLIYGSEIFRVEVKIKK
jgi:hypothetical protein